MKRRQHGFNLSQYSLNSCKKDFTDIGLNFYPSDGEKENTQVNFRQNKIIGIAKISG